MKTIRRATDGTHSVVCRFDVSYLNGDGEGRRGEGDVDHSKQL
jgi:hypothetical protein